MSASERKNGIGWLAGLAVALIVTTAGFAIGLVAGVSWEEPGLVLGWLSGETEGIAWGVEDAELPLAGEPGAEPDVAAPPPLGERPADSAVVSPTPPLVPSADPAAPPPAPSATRADRATAAPAPAVAAAAETGRFSVQVGAFEQRQAADRLASSLRGAGYSVYLSDSGRGARWRVRVGPHTTRAAAERTAERLKRDRALPTWVLSEDS